MVLPPAALAKYDAAEYYAAQQSSGRQAINGMGRVPLHREPTRLRMYVQVAAKGKNLKEALAKLKDRREAATLELERLKADEKSIVFSSPSLSSTDRRGSGRSKP